MRYISALDEFRARLLDEWLLPLYAARGLPHTGFVDKGIERLREADARDFLFAVDNALVHHRDGIFTAACSKAKEQIFSHGNRNSVPRTIHLWLEPIITIAALSRLVRDFGWPVHRVGMQSRSWAFDLVGYAEDQETELLVCEVKNTERNWTSCWSS